MVPRSDPGLSRRALLDYFLEGVAPRSDWMVGMELEKLGRRAADGRPLHYEGDGPCVRTVLEAILERRGGEPIREDGRLIGMHAPWGSITLEPGGQVEWSSRPQRTLDELEDSMRQHLAVMNDVGLTLGVRWLDLGLDPDHSVSEMPWMPKERYDIMREYFRSRGRLAHRMMTQTASIQCAFDFADATDWARKFRAAAVLAPLATALFANSSRVDGAESGYRCFRQAIWRETDDDRCGLPAIVFDDGFDLERWVEWLLDVPLLFRRDGDGLAAPDGRSFRQVWNGPEGSELTTEDWTTHCSSVFTEVRSYTYMEVRCADVQPDAHAFAVPAFWTGTLYDEEALEAALAAGAGLGHPAWLEAMDSAARDGLEGTLGGRSLRELASRFLGLAARGLERDAPWTGGSGAARHLERLAARLSIDVRP